MSVVPNKNGERTTSIDDLYTSIYQKPKYDVFCNFDCCSGKQGIPHYARTFLYFDPVNTTHDWPKYDQEFRTVCYIDFCHAFEYLARMTENVLSDRKYDHIVNGIISFLLEWTDASLCVFGEKYPQFAKLCAIISNDRAIDNYAYLYAHNSMPFTKMAMKMVKKFFHQPVGMKLHFDWMCLIDHSFVNHIRYVYSLLLENRITPNVIATLESEMAIPYKLANIDENLEHLRAISNHKFITGQACCGKTTLLNEFRKIGWKVYSRGDCGSFGGKATSPAAVGCMHSALEYVLTRGDVIGDRGYIDNILWAFIMEACDPKKTYTLVDDFFRFLCANFNEPSIANFITQRGVVFIDPYPLKNLDRLLKRATEGDPHRSRVIQYPHPQFICYYTAARLFGWKVVCVPYNSNGAFEPSQYTKIGQKLQKIFGEPKSTNMPFVRFAKPLNNYTTDNTYPKAVGIFK